MHKRWLIKPTPAPEKIELLSKAINVNWYLSAILIQRGIQDFETAKTYFRPSLNQLHDPFLMQDMDKAVTRIKQAIDGEEKILIYGDYDVDGVTATALMVQALSALPHHPLEGALQFVLDGTVRLT